MNTLPYGRQEISEDDLDAVDGALRSALITQGPQIGEFEAAVCEFTGAKHAVAFSSGTAALHGAAGAAGFEEGDEVLVPAVTFVASANCAAYVGAKPVLVDIDRETWNMDAETAAALAGEREDVRGAVAVSFAGLPADLDLLCGLDDFVLIEDACHALGGTRGGRPVGGPGGADMTAFSFHPVKAMTTGEGGMVTTEDDELADRLRRFRTHGITRDPVVFTQPDGPWAYDMVELGFNYRLTGFQAALGMSQLTHLEGWIGRRNELARQYRELLESDARIELPPEAGEDVTHAYHIFPIRIQGGSEVRLAVFEALHEAGILVQVHYIPLYRFSYYRERFGFENDAFPESERYYAGAVTLPLFPAMSTADVNRVVDELGRALDATGQAS